MIRSLVLCVAVLLSACAKSDETASVSTSSPPAVASATTAVVSGTALRGSVVTLTAVNASDPLPPGPAVMDQIGKQFVPELLLVRIGQPVEFRNSEDMEHNVIVVRTRTGRSVFNASPPPFQKYVHTFSEPGAYSVSCDIHPGMRATVVAVDTPYAVVTDPSGTFVFRDVPPGTYTLTVFGDRADVERTIDVTLPTTEVRVER